MANLVVYDDSPSKEVESVHADQDITIRVNLQQVSIHGVKHQAPESSTQVWPLQRGFHKPPNQYKMENKLSFLTMSLILALRLKGLSQEKQHLASNLTSIICDNTLGGVWPVWPGGERWVIDEAEQLLGVTNRN